VIAAVERYASAPDSDGWRTAVVPIESLDHAQAEGLGFEPLIAVIAPEEPRPRMRAAARGPAGRYG